MSDPERLYVVRLWHEVVVLACDHAEANGRALAAAEHGFSYDQPFDTEARGRVGHDRTTMPEGWEHEKPIGFQGHETEGPTCREILDAEKAKPCPPCQPLRDLGCQ